MGQFDKAWRLDIAVVVICVAMTAVDSFGETNSAATNFPVSPPTEITTRDGATYKCVKLLKVEPDGLFVDYTPKGGGIGIAKLKFLNLPEHLQRQYGYDTQKAAAYEAECQRSSKELKAKMWKDFNAECSAAAKYRQENDQEMARRREERKRQEKERILQEKERKWEEEDAKHFAQVEAMRNDASRYEEAYAWGSVKDPGNLEGLRRSGSDPNAFSEGRLLQYQTPTPGGMYRPPAKVNTYTPVIIHK